MRRVALVTLGACLLGCGPASTLAQSPSPGLDEMRQRVEVPTWGFALTFPGDWTVIDTTRADIDAVLVQLEVSHPGMASNIKDLADAGYLAAFPLFASAPVEAPALWGANCMISLSPATTDLGSHLDLFLDSLAATPGVVGEPEATVLALPAGDAARVDHEYVGPAPDGTEVPTTSSAYLLIDGEILYGLTCGYRSPPDDRWRSIAETFEFLPGH